MTLVLRCIQVITSKDIHGDLYESLSHWRNAASHRYTFNKVVTKFTEWARLKNNESIHNKTRSTSFVSQDGQSTTSSLSTPRFEDNDELFGAVQSGFSPVNANKRKIVKKDDLTPEDRLKQRYKIRVKDCTGFPVYSVKQNTSCTWCGTQGARWFCVSCKSWFCTLTSKAKPSKGSKEKEEKSVYNCVRGISENGSSIIKQFQRSCFHIHF